MRRARRRYASSWTGMRSWNTGNAYAQVGRHSALQLRDNHPIKTAAVDRIWQKTELRDQGGYVWS